MASKNIKEYTATQNDDINTLSTSVVCARVCVCVCACVYIYIYKVKGKVIPLQARCDPEGG